MKHTLSHTHIFHAGRQTAKAAEIKWAKGTFTDLQGRSHVELLGVVAKHRPRRVQLDEAQNLAAARLHHLLQHKTPHR